MTIKRRQDATKKSSNWPWELEIYDSKVEVRIQILEQPYRDWVNAQNFTPHSTRPRSMQCVL